MAPEKSLRRPEQLSPQQRTRIFDKTENTVLAKYFDPEYNGSGWPERAKNERRRIIEVADPEAFELAMHDLVTSLGTSHTGFFHQSVRRVPARLAIGANFRKVHTAEGLRWVVQDVHQDGPAYRAGLRPLDVLRTVDAHTVTPPEQPMFPMGSKPRISVVRDSVPTDLEVDIPIPRSRKQPYAEPKAVVSSVLEGGIGYLKVAILPGLLGLDVAREIDAAVETLAQCDRLILDLRGHLGGGLGVLRLMSHLTPEKIPIGYTLSRAKAASGYKKEEFKRLDRLPTNLPNPLAIASMALRFARRDPSVVLVSEGLPRRKWHGRIVILVNEHTVSAGEMVAAFAQENNLAKIVGTETAGRLIPGSGFNVGEGYMVILPKAAYITWVGHRYEGHGIKPDVEIPWSPDDFAAGHDSQLEAGIKLGNKLSADARDK
jgi:carboxyl-terminal processing protease